MDRRYQVFVSSTYTDLVKERKEVTQAILKCGCFPAGMELFSAEDKKQWDILKRVIDESDFYLVIISGKYGSTCCDDTGKSVSYTEMEFDYAVSAKKTIIALLLDKKVQAKLIGNRIDKEIWKRERLELFRQKAMEGRIVDFWTNKDQLHAAVFHGLRTAKESALDTMGWVRVSDIVGDKLKLPSDFQIFITGTYGVGKSTVAEEIKNKTNIHIIQRTDIIKYALRDFIKQRNINLEKTGYSHIHGIAKILSDDKLIEDLTYDCNEENFKKQCSLLLNPIIRISNDLAYRDMPAIIDGINLPIELLKRKSKEKNRMFINLYVDDISLLTDRLRSSYKRMNLDDAECNINLRKNSMGIINTYFKNGYDDFIQENNKPDNVLNIKTDNMTSGEVVSFIMNKISELLKKCPQ